METKAIQLRAHQKNIERYRGLLKTKLTRLRLPRKSAALKRPPAAAHPQGSSLRNFSDWPQRSHRNVSNVGFSGRTFEPASSILLVQRRQTGSSPVAGRDAC